MSLTTVRVRRLVSLEALSQCFVHRVLVERAGPPVPSCLSMKSDLSMDHQVNFRGEFTGDQRVLVERAGSPVPSCLSMKSDHSMDQPLFLVESPLVFKGLRLKEQGHLYPAVCL
ncbi:hypothetical protein ANANG_G00282410 [Anguilla anguilla]|uniref:Uncharacterized protein n=1 Tax=Anguilla anguilla TaxID=7936 RepID=A0A9D3LPC7_ANGAN|nr:hypothetical protein ANANG_G00282410 [Anguilla anguilla]